MNRVPTELSILFITRKFPPMKGGMERVAHQLYISLSKQTDTKLVKWGGSQIYLPLVLPYLFIKSYAILWKKKRVVYLQDALLSPLGLVLKVFGNLVVVTVHGLDVTFRNPLYQQLIPWCLRRLDKIVCISENTKKECLLRGIEPQKITVIPDGVSDEFYLDLPKQNLRNKASKVLGISLSDKKILLSVGRLVERKGFHWFINNVLQQIVEVEGEIVYLIVGAGPYKNQIKSILKKRKLDDYVYLLGEQNDQTLRILYNITDVFVMPNIQVDGDVEGFGIVALEASSCAIPVVASRIDGIIDAIKDDENGLLVPSKNVQIFTDTILRLLNDKNRNKFGERARAYTLINYDWQKIARKYRDVFKNILPLQDTP